VWLQWAGMKAKVPKCHSLAFKSSSAEPVDPKLQLSGQPIPFIGNKDIQFLGMTVQVPRDRVGAKQKLVERLDTMLMSVDRALLTRQQKMKLYKQAVCPRLTWLLTVDEYPLTWIERELEVRATRCLKRWAGLAKSANTSLLYLTLKDDGLNLPSISSIYKSLQVSKKC